MNHAYCPTVMGMAMSPSLQVAEMRMRCQYVAERLEPPQRNVAFNDGAGNENDDPPDDDTQNPDNLSLDLPDKLTKKK